MTATATNPSNSSKRGAKGPRPRHVPQRTAWHCRDKTNKRALFRIVRTSDGQAEVDLTGRKAGRGAYICAYPCLLGTRDHDEFARSRAQNRAHNGNEERAPLVRGNDFREPTRRE